MKLKKSVANLFLVTITVALVSQTCSIEATLWGKLLHKRQSSESEQEGTTAPSSSNGNNQGQTSAGVVTPLPPRLYPDLPQPPIGGNVASGPRGHFSPNHGLTPFVPFGMQLPMNRFNDQPTAGMGQFRPMPMIPARGQRPMTSSERLQSQTFTNGLGKRLLSMVGLAGDSSMNEAENAPSQVEGRQPLDDTMKALQNSTVLHQLNMGVQSIYGGLSKMYNETVRQQLEHLQERFRKEAENSTNPWQQRMAQQVPMYFNSLASKVGEAQENLNRLWRQMTQVNGSQTESQQQQPMMRSFFNSFDHFMGPNEPGAFINQIGRSLGFNGNDMDGFGFQNPAASGQNNIGAQVMNFWHSQVQPQIGMLRGEVARIWRGLTATGALPAMDPMTQFRTNNGPNRLGGAEPTNVSAEVMNDLLKEVDMNNSDYMLIDHQNLQQQNQSNSKPMISLQMQNSLMNMQREINQLWSGLSRSLQNVVSNMRNTVSTMAQPNDKKEIDPAVSEIDGKIKDLTKIQRDADSVYNVVQQQQQQQQAQQQQRPSFSDRFNAGNVGNF